MGKGRNVKFKKLSKGYRKFIRREKSRIRREIFDSTEQERLIKELMARFRSSE